MRILQTSKHGKSRVRSVAISPIYLTLKIVLNVAIVLGLILGYDAFIIVSDEHISRNTLLCIAIASTSIAVYMLVYPLMDTVVKVYQYIYDLAAGHAPSMPHFSGILPNLSSEFLQAHKALAGRQVNMEAQIVDAQSLFNAIPAIIFLVSKDGKIIRTNQFAYRIFGEALVGMDIATVIESNELKQSILKVFNEGNNLTMSVSTETDPKCFYDVHVQYYDMQGQYNKSALVVVHDISEIKRTDLILTNFIANASHEVRTPLTAIVGAVDMLAFSGWHSDAIKEFMPILKEQTDRMCSLVNQLITLLNVERTQYGHDFMAVHLPDLLPLVLRQLERSMNMSDIKLQACYEEGLVAVYGNPWELEHALYQLINNAILHGGAGKQIILKAGVADLNGVKMIYVSVNNQGEKIPPEHLPRITERFYRTDASRSRKIGGSGLGLAIVKQILVKHKGHLDVKSGAKEGTTFTMYLPIFKQH